MPLPISSARCRCDRARAALALAAAAFATVFAPPMIRAASLMPQPAEFRPADGRLPVTAAFRVATGGAADERVRAALARGLARWEKRTGLKFAGLTESAAGATLLVECERPAPPLPELGEDESYTLDVTPERAVLRAPTSTGALRGVETVLQLLEQDGGGWFLPAASVRDRPRFPWRGLMIDVARHFQPLEVIERNLEGMALVKLNVLHLHLCDDQGFRIESRTHPELHRLGSDGQFFTQKQMREIVAYAAAHGIRVVPEFDIPGHATSWAVSHPELASAPGPYQIERRWGIFDTVLDPSRERVYEIIEDLVGEMTALFPDPYFHIGGDENNGKQWDANEGIQRFIRERKLGDNAGLHAHFNRRVGEILRRHGRKLVGWDEILHPTLPADSVIHSWRGPASLAEAAQRGFSGILSSGFYIDLNHPASAHYLVEPLPADTPLDAAQQKRVLGGEATMWAEWVTPDFIDTRIWPRTAAIAERLWSPREVRDVEDMYRRLAIVDLRLQEAGLQHGNWPRLDLPGLAPNGRIAGALRQLAALVEPVKDYRRGGLQPAATQLTPLNELADWARPESLTARAFNLAVERWLFAPGELSTRQAEALAGRLATWREVGDLAAQAPAADTPVAQDRVRTARALVALTAAGDDAIAALRSGQPLGPGQRAAARAAFEGAQPTAAAVEFPILHSLRLLSAAAEKPARRDAISRDAWRAELESALRAAGEAEKK